MYTPNPMNLKEVELPNELNELLEQMAEQVHESWAYERINAGWVYGVKRNDDLKTHPCLVPFSQLSDSEKHYDRVTAEQTLKLVLSYGYKIVK